MRRIPGRTRQKFGNVRHGLDGFAFDSKLKRDHYAELKLRVRARETTDLEVHPRIPPHAPGPEGRPKRIGKMVPDFRYRLYAQLRKGR